MKSPIKDDFYFKQDFQTVCLNPALIRARVTELWPFKMLDIVAV